MKSTKVFFSAFAALIVLAQAAMAGPPLICHALNIGDAKSLPWNVDARYSSSGGWSLSGKADYDVSRLVGDTLAILAPSTPVIVRMETIRRATLYTQQNPEIAKQLLSSLRSRAVDAESNGRRDALAWFDLGYLVECYKQANQTYKQVGPDKWEPEVHANPASGLDGYACVRKAIGLRSEDPQMEFAAALITMEGPAEARGHRLEHAKLAVAGAARDPLLAANLDNRWDRETMAALLTK